MQCALELILSIQQISEGLQQVQGPEGTHSALTQTGPKGHLFLRLEFVLAEKYKSKTGPPSGFFTNLRYLFTYNTGVLHAVQGKRSMQITGIFFFFFFTMEWGTLLLREGC